MATLNENVQSLQLFALLCLVASLWKNPLGGRFIRQRRGGIFHRLRAALWRAFSCISYRLFRVHLGLVVSLHRVGAPDWLVDFPFVPRIVRSVGAQEYLRRHPFSDEAEGVES